MDNALIEQLKEKAPVFFSENDLERIKSNAIARVKEYETKVVTGTTEAFKLAFELGKQGYKLKDELTSKSGQALYKISYYLKSSELKKLKAEAVSEATQAYQLECDQKLADWLEEATQDAIEAFELEERAKQDERKKAFQSSLLDALKA